jgi:hypothetical protein
MGEGRGMYRFLVGKPEGMRPLGKPRLSRDVNIKMDLQEVECGSMDRIELAHYRDRWWVFVTALMKPGLYKMREIS